MQKDETFSHKTGLFSVVKKDFFSIPISIRIVSLSVFLFLFGRGLGGDTFFSVYVKSIVNTVFRVSLIGALLPLVKMFFSVSVGQLDDHSDIRSVIFISKAFYIVASILFFLAGICHSIPLLIIAVVINSIGSGSLFTSYATLIRKYSQQQNRSTSFGLFFSSANFAQMVGALIASVIVKYIDIPHLYLFIALFAFVSFITDSKLPHLGRKKIKQFLGKESFIHQFFREAFSLRGFQKAIVTLQSANRKLYQALRFEFLRNILNYIGFLFIPLVALQNNLSLSQIAIIFAIMRIPYVINFFAGEFADKYSKKRFILFVLLFISFLIALLGFRDGFFSIIIISFGIALGLSLIRPVISGLISDYTEAEVTGGISGIDEFIAKFGEVAGALLFGLISLIVGMDNTFICVGIAVFVFAAYNLIRRYYRVKKNLP